MNKTEFYDVVIVGAGPAGLRCAEVLGGTDLSVLLIDRKVSVGPKTCAGGLRLPDGYFTLPDHMTSTFGRHYFLLGGKEYSLPLRKPLHIVDRTDLGRYQLDLIRDSKNVIVETGTSAGHIAADHILLNEGRKIRYRYLVGADGSNSLVRRSLGLGNRLYVGTQYIIPEAHDKLVWFFNPELLGSGYGWIFPHRTFTSAGVFFNPAIFPARKAREALDKLLQGYGLHFRDAKLEGAPVNCLYKGIKFNNIFLTGDAAGLASACTGEGMVYAVASGDDVARHIIDNSYRFDRIRRLLKYKKRQEFILYVFDKLPRYRTSLFRIFISLLRRPAFQRYYSGDF